MKDNKKSALILGASGLVGSKLLSLLLDSDNYNKIVAPAVAPSGLPVIAIQCLQ